MAYLRTSKGVYSFGEEGIQLVQPSKFFIGSIGMRVCELGLFVVTLKKFDVCTFTMDAAYPPLRRSKLYTLGTCLLILTLWLAWWHWVSNQTNIGTLGQLQPSLYTVPGVLLPYQAFSTLAALRSQLLRESLTDTTKVPSVNSSLHRIHSARCLMPYCLALGTLAALWSQLLKSL